MFPAARWPSCTALTHSPEPWKWRATEGGSRTRLVGGVKFYQRKEIRDTLSFLRVVHNPADDAALERIINVPARGISQRTMVGTA